MDEVWKGIFKGKHEYFLKLLWTEEFTEISLESIHFFFFLFFFFQSSFWTHEKSEISKYLNLIRKILMRLLGTNDWVSGFLWSSYGLHVFLWEAPLYFKSCVFCCASSKLFHSFLCFFYLSGFKVSWYFNSMFLAVP